MGILERREGGCVDDPYDCRAASSTFLCNARSLRPMGPVPAFDAERPRYDLSTLSGRFFHFANMIDPRNLIAFESDVRASQGLLKDFTEDADRVRARGVTDAQLWDARKCVESAIHPSTGSIVPAPFRMAAFTPVNIPIVYFMITTKTPSVLLFWHWVNQSYNTAVNYHNRSAPEVNTAQILKSYVLAVATSCSLAVGLGKAVEKGYFKGPPALVSYCAVAAAGASNIIFSRQNELQTGTAVFDADGNVRGNSVKAGRSVVLQTAVSRGLFIPAPVLLLPPAIMAALARLKLVPSNPRLRLGAELLAITASLGGALPLAMAMYPQKCELRVSDLEPQFQGLTDAEGRRIEVLYANKGL